ncbi:MAG TPA: alpha-2-macroglobulin, partial [Chitinophagaceae bacterium]|nr:alpha-2-macroglobulin [Chitinophagaceae bacterium]
MLSREEAVAKFGSAGANGAILITTSDNAPPVTIRKNFNETAFFFPHLYADTAGNYSFSFTMPDALTRWKWMSLAHTKDLAFGSNSTSIITQKTLMVQANAPRFVREGDKMELSAKISNLSNKEISGQVVLELIDAATGTSVDGWFQNVFPVQYFTAAAGQSTAIKFPVQVPFSFNKTLTWRLSAKADTYSDGEENMLPVLTNRQLVTESLPILITKDTTQSFRFEKLIQANSPSLTHEAVTINYTTNPIWEAIRALPYLMEYPYECVEQTFNRFYANALGSYIINRDPKIRKVFESWLKDTATAKSKLQLNASLKQIMIEETPWVFAAQSEEEQQKNIAMLFDVFRLSQQADQLIQKIQDMQLPDGSFSWFKGGYGDRYMTNYVITGLGKLKRIGALTPDIAIRLKPLIEKSVAFMDEAINKEYQSWKKSKLDTTRTLISGSHIQYLYMRSFYRDIALPKYAEAYNFFYNRGKLQIHQQSIYHRALLGLVYYRNNEIRYVNVNLRSAVLENAVREESKSTLYWKDRLTYSWYQTPIEHQATMIQFLQELQQGQPMLNGNNSIDEARNWLLLNKQSNNWKTTVATAEACYALLMTGTDLLHTEKNISIQLGNNSYTNQDRKTEAGTGYFQQRIEGR